MFRNPHIASGGLEEPELPRLRFVTNDPEREYASRPGAVQRLPDGVAALILCKTGRCVVERHAITVTIEEEKVQFTSENSVTIRELNGLDKPVLWALNRLQPDLLHILTEDGAYVESIPRKGEAQWFSNDANSQRAIATARGHMARDLERLGHLHAPDSRKEAERQEGNAAEIRRVVSTFPVESSQEEGLTRRRGGAEEFPKSDRFTRAMGEVDRQRNETVEKERTHAAQIRAEERRAAAVGEDEVEELLEVIPPQRADASEEDAACVDDIL